MRKFISLLLICSFIIQLFTQSLYAQYLPNLSAGISGITTSTAIPPTPALLRYVSVNSANPFNYFNFLLDKGTNESQDTSHTSQVKDTSAVAEGLRGGVVGSAAEAKKLVNYFFLGLTIPEESLWVNLQPERQKSQDTSHRSQENTSDLLNGEQNMISKELSNTDMGRVLLEQDLQLKKDMARYLHPQVYEGQLFWRKLNEEAQGHNVTKTQEKAEFWQKLKDKFTVNRPQSTVNQFDVPYRVWIVPDSATVVETEDGALVTEAKLKVMLEVEYLEEKIQGHNDTKSQGKTEFKNNDVRSTKDDVQEISKQLLKEIIIPKIIQAVNESPKYAPLRQIYHSLVLAQWYKVRHGRESQSHKSQDTSQNTVNQLTNQQTNQLSSPYQQAINKGWTKGLEAELPWSKQKIWKEYQESYAKGEYNTQANLIGIGVRKFFSGGIDLTRGWTVSQTSLSAYSSAVTLSSPMSYDTPPKFFIIKSEEFSKIPLISTINSSPLFAQSDTKFQDNLLTVFSSSVEPLTLRTEPLVEEEIKFSVSSPTHQVEGSEDKIVSSTVRQIEVKKVWDLYKIGDSKKFRESLVGLGIIPDKLIAEVKGYTEKYLRDEITTIVFKELPRIGAEKRVFESDSLDFVIGFEYSQDAKNNYPPTGRLPVSFNIAYERGGGLVGRIFYLQDVNLKYFDSAGQQREITVPYLLVQEKLIEFGKKIEGLKNMIEKGIDVDKNTGLVKDLLNQFIEINKEMYRRGFLNWDIKISCNYGVTRNNRVVLLDTGGIATNRNMLQPLISWYVSLPYGVDEPNYWEELSQKNIQKLWDTDLDSITRSTFVNADLEKPLQEIIESNIQAIQSSPVTYKQAVEIYVTAQKGLRESKEFQSNASYYLEADKLLGELIVGKILESGKSYSLENLASFLVLTSVGLNKDAVIIANEFLFKSLPMVNPQTTKNKAQIKQSSPIDTKGGIDLSNIELTLKDEKFVSSLNPADQKIILAAKALKQGFAPLSLLRIYEAVGFVKDKIIQKVENTKLLAEVIGQLKVKMGDFIDSQFLQLFDSFQPDMLFVKP